MDITASKSALPLHMWQTCWIFYADSIVRYIASEWVRWNSLKMKHLFEIGGCIVQVSYNMKCGLYTVDASYFHYMSKIHNAIKNSLAKYNSAYALFFSGLHIFFPGGGGWIVYRKKYTQITLYCLVQFVCMVFWLYFSVSTGWLSTLPSLKRPYKYMCVFVLDDYRK